MSVTIRNPAADRYMQLVAKFPLRRLGSAAEHAKAKRLLLRLSAEQRNRGVSQYIDVLVDLIADYERRAGYVLEMSKMSAAELVRHRIEQRTMSVSALARLVGVPQSNLSEMLSGKRDWSKTAIRGLASQLNIRADRFLA